jgi:beta-lactamase superfamily II metal-dependent hydrolase
MAAKKRSKKAAAPKRSTKKQATKKPPRQEPPARSSAAAAKPRGTTGPSEPAGLRVRMYRVGFGDFFLLTFPASGGEEHVLIDCGVFKGTSGQGDLHSIEAAVDNLAQATGGSLALVIMTHRHADHIIGFSRCKAQFQKMKVGAVWMPAWESEYDTKAQAFQAQLTATALKLDAHLATRAGDADPRQAAALDMLYNATGAGSLAVAGGGTNAASLDLLKRGFGVKPEYYAAGDTAKVPDVLAKAGLSARILGPPPVDDLSLMKLMDLTKGVGEYLTAAEAGDDASATLTPFDPKWRADAQRYPDEAFREWAGAGGATRPHARMEKAIAGAQPTSLYAAAKTLDSFLNNQSLVVLFTFAGKRLLFVGDAQAGNWEHWLYDTSTPEKSPPESISSDGASILESLDFYKVGHHGSTNATPKAVVDALPKGIVAMCSTQPGVYGTEAKGTEVPRIPLLEAIAGKCELVRSDQIALEVDGTKVPAGEGAPTSLAAPAQGEVVAGECWIDYTF